MGRLGHFGKIRLWTSFESSPASVKFAKKAIFFNFDLFEAEAAMMVATTEAVASTIEIAITKKEAEAAVMVVAAVTVVAAAAVAGLVKKFIIFSKVDN